MWLQIKAIAVLSDRATRVLLWLDWGLKTWLTGVDSAGYANNTPVSIFIF